MQTVELLSRPRVVALGDSRSADRLSLSVFGGEAELLLEGDRLGVLGQLALEGRVLRRDARQMTFELGSSFALDFANVGRVARLEGSDLGAVEGSLVQRSLTDALSLGELLGRQLRLGSDVRLGTR